MSDFLGTIKLPVVTTDPTAVAGRVIYNSTDGLPKWSNGTTWYRIDPIRSLISDDLTLGGVSSVGPISAITAETQLGSLTSKTISNTTKSTLSVVFIGQAECSVDATSSAGAGTSVITGYLLFQSRLNSGAYRRDGQMNAGYTIARNASIAQTISVGDDVTSVSVTTIAAGGSATYDIRCLYAMTAATNGTMSYTYLNPRISAFAVVQ